MESNRITFHDVREADSGLYTISCCNDDGEEGQGTVELEVTPTTQPATQHSHPSQTGEEKFSMSVRCTATKHDGKNGVCDCIFLIPSGISLLCSK